MKPVEPSTYRATKEAWLGQLLLPLAFFAVLTFTALWQTGMNPWVGGLGLGFLVVIAVLDYALPMLRNWVMVDDRSIEGTINGSYFNLYWTEIAAAWMYRRSRRAYLCLGTRERTVVVPMRFLDMDAVWESVCAYAAPAALTDEALRRLPDLQSGKRKLSGRDMLKNAVRAPGGESVVQANSDERLTPKVAVASPKVAVADHWLIQISAWTGVTFFFAAALKSFTLGLVWQAGLFGLLALASALLLLNWGLTEFTAAEVERFTLFGGWRIRWDCVRRVEVGLLGAVIVLIGDDCQLVIPGMGLWSGSDRRSAQALLLAELERRGIPLQRTWWATFKFSRRQRTSK